MGNALAWIKQSSITKPQLAWRLVGWKSGRQREAQAGVREPVGCPWLSGTMLYSELHSILCVWRNPHDARAKFRGWKTAGFGLV